MIDSNEIDWDLLLEIHQGEIIKTYGQERYNQCNLGWATGEWGVCSKIYALKDDQITMCCDTSIDPETGAIYTIHEPY